MPRARSLSPIRRSRMPKVTNGNARAGERLKRLEAASMGVLRQVVARCARPAMLFSAGKDSCVMLHLARKAFAGVIPPFPLLHVDTTWEFPETYPFRDRMAQTAGMPLIVQVNREAAEQGVGPFTHGAGEHTRLMKNAALKAAIDAHRIDAVIDGARGDEERTRGSGNPGLARHFPLADWAELDVWRYIEREGIELPKLYFAAPRRVVERSGLLIVRVDERMPLAPGEEPRLCSVRFRSLGCWPLTGAVKSSARDIPAVVRELKRAGTAERHGRAQDLAKVPAGAAQADYF